MKTNKILITINKLDDLKKLKELGIEKFVFPLKDFCVGIPNTFLMSEIKEDGYLLINRILDNKGIDDLKGLLKEIPNNIKGIIFDDLGIIPLIKDISLEKILYLSHFNSNKESIKAYLEYVDSVIISTDIKEEEINYITREIPNKLTVFVLGYIKSMYSRRLLIDNYTKYHKIDYQNPITIQNTNHKFIVYENQYGTIFYHYPIFNGTTLFKYPCKYYFINSSFLDLNIISAFISGKNTYEFDRAFLDTGTIYKLKGDKNG